MQNGSTRPLVRHVHSSIKRGGGGAGYLYNLRLADNSLRDGPAPLDVQFDFCELEPTVPKKPSSLRHIRRQIGRLARWSGLRKERRLFGEQFSQTVETWKAAAAKQIPTKQHAARLFECDLLFVHHIMIADWLTKLQPHLSRKKLVLMTHAPTYIAHEIASNLEPMADTSLLYENSQVNSVVDWEVQIMNSVRAVVWPCPEAQDGYPGWREKRHETTQELLIETGVARPSAEKGSEKQRAEWGISPDKRIALFMGRPHPHKGFCRFLDWADFNKKAKRKDWVFVFAGDKPLMDRDVSALRKVGYINDNGSAYCAADLILVPNRNSYLDIGLLEMLSLGAKAAISPTGGHKHVQKICPTLATIPDDSVEASWNVLEAAANEYATNQRPTQDLVQTWEKRFSLNPFRINHISAVQRLLV